MGLNENHNPPGLLAEALATILKPIVKEAVQEAINGHREEDRLLDAEEASKVLSVSVDWIYRNARRLPFSHKLGPKILRFSYQGMQKWLAIRKIATL